MAMNNTHTKKQYAGTSDAPVKKAQPPKDVHAKNVGAKYEGEFGAQRAKFAAPMNTVSAQISGLGGTHNDIGELSGFITDGYLEKNGMGLGEDLKLNFLPPGMDISNQMNAEIHEMPLRTVVDISYPGDGWMPAPRDLPE
jgi:hypothetical protein